MTSKINKETKIQCIQLFFQEQGKRMTNLNKAKISRLDEIITQYNINIDLYNKKIIENIEKQKELDRQNQLKIQLEKIERERFNNEIKIKWNSLTNDERYACYKILFYKKYYVSQEEADKYNEKLSKDVDKLIEKLKVDNCIIERININEFKANGITIIHDHIKKSNLFEDYLDKMMEEDQQEYTYLDKDIIEMINNYINDKQQKQQNKKKIKKIIIIESDTEDEL